MWLKYVPSIINVALIVVFGGIYTKLTFYLVKNENHRFMSSLENSMINKTYMFQFINVYISNFVYIMYNQDFNKLQTNMITVMVVKQVLYNVMEYTLLACNVNRKIRNVKKLFMTRLVEIKD